MQTANDFKAVSGFISQKPVAEFSKRDRLSAVPAGTRPPPPRIPSMQPSTAVNGMWGGGGEVSAGCS